MRRRLLPLLLAGLGFFTSPVQAQDRETTLARIKREGVLRWGSDGSGGAPFVFPNPENLSQIVGFEVELVERLAGALGVKAVREQIDWPALPDSLKAGRIDLALNGLEVTDERAREVLFTLPYFRFAQQLTVRPADAGRYHTLDDLKGRKVAVLNGSASIDVLKKSGWTEDLIVVFDDSLKPFDAVKQERADACLCEWIISNYYADGDRELHVVPGTFSPGVYAGAVRKDDVELKTALDGILRQLKESGELGEMYQRWLIWSEDQRELGVQRGKDQPMSPLARKTFKLTVGRALQLGKLLLKGAWWTLLLTALSMPIALAFGLALALMSMSKRWWVRWPARFYIQVIRGTPLLVQIFVIFFSLPLLGHALGLGNLLTWPAFAVGVLCLSANYAAYEAEIHRAGIEAVPKGQRLAALALGMTERQAFFHVVLPQSFRIILPPVINDLVSMLKDSCLVSVVGVSELLFVAGSVGKATFLYGQMLLAAAAIYLVLSLAADRFGRYLEARLRQRGFNVVGGTPPRH
jgi:polar amino acid transport system substrate-binding protein